MALKANRVAKLHTRDAYLDILPIYTAAAVRLGAPGRGADGYFVVRIRNKIVSE